MSETAKGVTDTAHDNAVAVEDRQAAAGAATAGVGEGKAAAQAVSPSSEESAADTPALAGLRKAATDQTPVEGRVFGWNDGGFHVVIGGTPAFCPRSEMETRNIRNPGGYVDKIFRFLVLRIEDQGRRIVVSRTAALQVGKARRLADIKAGAVLKGKVASITDFGAFVDLGGVQGLVHVSELSRRQVEHARDMLEVGQEVAVKVLKVEKGGKRISLSMKALEPDPWDHVKERYEEGSVVTGKVERTVSFGTFVSLEPGLTGLLPASKISLPQGSQLARTYPPGKQISVLIDSIDAKRRRISLAPEGTTSEGSRADYIAYKRRQKQAAGGFNALADALQKVQHKPDSRRQ